MKKILLILVSVLIVSSLFACSNEQPKTTTTTTTTTTTKNEDPKGGITLSETNLIIGVGETKKLSVFNIETNSETFNVLWESSDSKVAAVDINGNVTGIVDGTAVITAKSIDGKYQATCNVTVSSVVSGVILDKGTLSLEVGENFGLNATVLPEGIGNNGVTWFSSVESVATVSDKGIVTAVGNGVTSIGVKTVDGDFSAFCTVTVTTAVRGINLQDVSVKLNKGVTTTLYYTISPMDATDKSVSWSTSDAGVATVIDGKVTAVGAGVATVTVTSTNGCSASCIVTVTSAVTGVTVNHSVLTLNVGNTEQLEAIIDPLDADDKSVRWSSSNSSVASVNSLNGIVTAVSSGSATITVTTVDGSFTASCEVTVIKPITALGFENENYSINKGDVLNLNIIKTPADADAEVLTVVSSDPLIATVDENGVVTGTGHGTVTITATSKYGVSASCTVQVTDPAMIRVPVTSVSVNNTQINLPEGGRFKLEVTILPDNATDKNYTFDISDKSVIKISGNEILAVSEGFALVTVNAADGKSVTVFVIVNKLSQEDIDKNISDYNTAVEKENTRHENALAQLKDNYDKESEFFRKALEAVNINKEQYTAQKAELESEINRLEGLMQEAALNNNQQLVSEYALQIAELNDQLSALEKKYSSRVEIDAKLAVIQSKYNDALAIENALYSANMAQIEYDYEFIKKYVKEKEEDDSHQPDNVGDDSGDDSENDGQTPETPSDVN